MSIQFSAVGLVSHDMKATLAFYRLLGFVIPPEADEQAHVEVTTGGGARLMWDSVDTVRTIDPGWRAPSGGHRAALAFECEAPSEVDRVYEALTAGGYRGHLAPWDAFWGQRYASVLDPDGNPVELFAALAG